MLYLASDHRGFVLKEKIKKWLDKWGLVHEDLGASRYDQDDDYPDFVSRAAEKVSQDPQNNRAIILGATGQGEAMVANRFPGVRAAVFYGPSLDPLGGRGWLLAVLGGDREITEKVYNKGLEKIISLSREHNDANVLSLGASFLFERAAKHFVKIWLETKFSGAERHQRRIDKIDKIEKSESQK